MTRPQPSPTAVAPPAADLVASDHHRPGGGGAGGDAVTAEDRAEADALVTATKLALASAGYEDVAVAEAAGYRPVQPPSSRLVHYVNLTHLVDPGVLDRPSAAAGHSADQTSPMTVRSSPLVSLPLRRAAGHHPLRFC